MFKNIAFLSRGIQVTPGSRRAHPRHWPPTRWPFCHYITNKYIYLCMYSLPLCYPHNNAALRRTCTVYNGSFQLFIKITRRRSASLLRPPISPTITLNPPLSKAATLMAYITRFQTLAAAESFNKYRPAEGSATSWRTLLKIPIDFRPPIRRQARGMFVGNRKRNLQRCLSHGVGLINRSPSLSSICQQRED